MKFTKDQAVEKLNQELTNNGKKPLRMSARTLEAQAETLMALVGDEEMELDDFVAKVKASLESVNANIEHDNSEFVKKYKEDHPEKKDDPKQDPKKEDDPDKTLLDKLQQQIDELKAQNQKKEEDAAIESKRSEIRKYLSENNVKDSKWIDSILSIATIGKDDDAQEKGKSFLELYNSSNGGSPVTPLAPNTGGGKNPDDLFSGVRALRKQEEAIGK